MKTVRGSSIVVLVSLLIACSTLPSKLGEQAYLPGKPKHHTATGFQNHPFIETRAAKGFWFYMRRFWRSFFIPDVPEGHVLSKDSAKQLLDSIQGDRISWLGHASFIIRLSGKNILTDPFLSEFASPISWAGPRRFVEHGISPEKLPPIDMLVVSHNHYDHLDDETVRSLPNKSNISVIVPLGLREFFVERGYSKIIELDWQQTSTVEGIEFTALPAVHDSARSTSDHNRTLWASWAIAGDTNRVFFVGDSGYSDSLFKQIGNQHTAFDYAIVPIGAYEPRELMWMSHVNPEEAVMIGKDVNARHLIASHWGTVSSLSDEPLWEPPQRFLRVAEELGFIKDSIWVFKIGETKNLELALDH